MLKNVVLALVILLVGISGVVAQQSGFKRTVLQKTDVPGGVYESVFVMAEVPPGGLVERHTHPGTEQGTVIERRPGCQDVQAWRVLANSSGCRP
jgi:hypothetical protein